MQLSRKALNAYDAAIKAQGGAAEKAALKAIDAWFAENPGASVSDTRDFCTRLMRELGRIYGQAAGDAAYALRDAVAQAAGIEPSAVVYDYAPEIESVTKTAHYQAGKLASGDVGAFRQAIGEASRYYAERGANDTMFHLTERDEERLGRKVRFARVPVGTTSCEWCLMLASRGFVYHSAASAGEANKFHRNCDCRIVPGYGGNPKVEGYDPDEYYDRWKHPEKYQDEQMDEEALVMEAIDEGRTSVTYTD